MNVAVFQSDTTSYPNEPPFHPPAPYPEIAQTGMNETMSSNSVYCAVRRTLALLGLDSPNFGTPHWNPLGQYVRPGDKVVIKPNFVLHDFGALMGTNCLKTHGSVIRAMIDYAYLAAGPDSSIVIADAPIQGADFELILKQVGIREIQDYYWRKIRYQIEVLDLRKALAVIDEESSFITEVRRLPGDPLGYQVIEMGRESRLSELDSPDTKYAVGDYDMTMTNRMHNNNHHQYIVSNTIFDANTVISVPKLKTHSKVGITVCLKNLIGIIGSKDCVPHHRYGKTSHGGDEFPDHYPMTWHLSLRAYTKLQGRLPPLLWKVLRSCAASLLGAGRQSNSEANDNFFSSGDWHGNDTLWRTVDDLNKLFFFYDKEKAQLASERQRRFFAMVDGIIAMEGNGPSKGIPKPCGVLLAGDDPLAVDVVAATLMGFDWRRIHLLEKIAASSDTLRYSGFSGDESEVNIISNENRWQSLEMLKKAHLGFIPPAGWRQYIEL